MPKTLQEVARELDIDKSEISTLNSKIFLCGGPKDSPTSLRRVLLSYLSSEQPSLSEGVCLAEAAMARFKVSDNHFANLVELEELIADISALILIIVESPGSIAELGAFTFVDRLRRKVVVVLDNQFYDRRSFIFDGPIALVNDQRVLGYSWLSRDEPPRFIEAQAIQTARSITDTILVRRDKFFADKSFVRNEKIERQKPAHIALLIADLISMAGALRRTEISSFVEDIGLQVRSEDLSKYLFLLESAGLIGKTRVGDTLYFVRGGSGPRFVTYSYRYDLHRLQRDVIDSLPEIGSRKEALISATTEAP